MTCLPYWRFFASDWLADTLALSLAERGAHITLLAWTWHQDRPLPLDAERRAAILGITTRELERTWSAIEHLWERTDEGWVNPHLEAERARAKARSAGARSAARSRWDADASANGIATAYTNGGASA